LIFSQSGFLSFRFVSLLTEVPKEKRPALGYFRGYSARAKETMGE
jgi:hypothetical protein